MSRQVFINALVSSRRRAFKTATRGVVTPDKLAEFTEFAELMMAEVERDIAEKAWDAAIGSCNDHSFASPNPYRKES